jgi:hypothetical protein
MIFRMTPRLTPRFAVRMAHLFTLDSLAGKARASVIDSRDRSRSAVIGTSR